jgi:hypothetical protein
MRSLGTRSRLDQQELAVLQLAAVLAIVQHARVGPAATIEGYATACAPLRRNSCASSASTWYSCQPTRVRSIAGVRARGNVAARASARLVLVLHEPQRVDHLPHVDDLFGAATPVRTRLALRSAGRKSCYPTQRTVRAAVYSAGRSRRELRQRAVEVRDRCASSKPKISRAHRARNESRPRSRAPDLSRDRTEMTVPVVAATSAMTASGSGKPEM